MSLSSSARICVVVARQNSGHGIVSRDEVLGGPSDKTGAGGAATVECWCRGAALAPTTCGGGAIAIAPFIGSSPARGKPGSEPGPTCTGTVAVVVGEAVGVFPLIVIVAQLIAELSPPAWVAQVILKAPPP